MDPIKNLIALVQEQLQRIPLKVRQWVYSVGALLAAVYAVYLAADGDWGTFWKSLIATGIGVVARANATPSAIDPATEEFVDEPEEAAPTSEPVTDWDTEVGSADITANAPTRELNLTTDRYGNIVTGE